MNRIDQLFQRRTAPVLSIYFTAGHPALNDTQRILQLLQESGVDLVEIGIPFSDPLADGPVIQQSSTKALQNGMTLSLLLEQLKNIRQEIRIPLILMGYLNPVLQYGIERFCRDAAACGIDGVILPDLPADIYEKEYKPLFRQHNLKNILLITPRTGEERIRATDKAADGFIYAVSASSTTGNSAADRQRQQEYFTRLRDMKLNNPLMIGFGISSREHFENAGRYATGGIIGSAFIRHIEENPGLETSIPAFIRLIR